SVQVVAGFSGAGASPPPPVATVSAGGTLHLAPGIYSINALPAPGTAFTNYSVGSGPVEVAAPRLPFTWFTVLAGSSSAEIRMSSSPTRADAVVYVYPVGDDNAANGSIAFDGARYPTFTANSTVGAYIVTVPVGSYRIAASATPGTTFVGWSIGGIAATLNASNTTDVELENGSIYLFGLFSALANLSLLDAGANGSISLGGGPFEANGSVVAYAAPPTGVALAADPPANSSFNGWSVQPGANASVLRPGAGVTTLTVNGSANVTADYVAATALGLSFSIVPAGSGTILLDAAPEANGSFAPYLAAGLYVAQFVPGPDEFLHAWSGTGGIALSNATPLGWPLGTELVNLTGSGGVLTAHVLRGTPPVTFLLATPPGPTPTFRVNGTTVAHNGTLDLGAGPIPVTLQGTLPTGSEVRAWTAVGGIAVVGANGSSATLFVNGSGAVMPLLAPRFAVDATATPVNATSWGAAEWAPETVAFDAAAVNGSAPFVFQWSFGDGSTAVGPAAAHRFGLPGAYFWSVAVTDAGGNLTSASGSVVVAGPPVGLRLNVTPLEGEPPFNVSLSMNTTGPSGASTFAWSVPGLGIAGTGPTGQFEVPSLGAYPLDAWAAGFQGFLAMGSTIITAEPDVFLTVSQSVSMGIAPLNVTFDAAAINATGATNFSWSFGDGATAFGPEVRHEYVVPGTYDANVTVLDALGGTDRKTLVVHVLAPPPPLVARLTADPARLVLGDTTTISTNVTGGVPSYAVAYVPRSLPPGCVALPEPPNASFRCTPQAAGNYSLEVNVTDSSGTTVHAAAWFNVTAPPPGRTVPPAATTGGSGWTPEELYGLLAGGIAIAIIVGLLVRGRGPSETPAGGEDLDLPTAPEGPPSAREALEGEEESTPLPDGPS
ncbi:MAG TPA: PKD domain-containing protein, partial [Thermoplasmata archaeon]|nr:PKD domain-containing protein [Thermoplasmata archaeon]